MYGQCGFIPSKDITQFLAPAGGNKQAAEAGRCLYQKGQHKEDMKQPICDTKSFNTAF
jgi:hypothetical protein